LPQKIFPHSCIARRPGGAYYGEFNHFSQLFVANGYVVLEPNPRGSSEAMEKLSAKPSSPTGATRIFRTYRQVDYAVAPGLADPDKLAVGGWSYGGISTTSSSSRPPASKRQSPAQVRLLRVALWTRPVTSLTTIWNSATRGKSRRGTKFPNLQSRKHHHPTLFMAATSTGMFR